jgi:hypothetical protein
VQVGVLAGERGLGSSAAGSPAIAQRQPCLPSKPCSSMRLSITVRRFNFRSSVVCSVKEPIFSSRRQSSSASVQPVSGKKVMRASTVRWCSSRSVGSPPIAVT